MRMMVSIFLTILNAYIEAKGLYGEKGQHRIIELNTFKQKPYAYYISV